MTIGERIRRARQNAKMTQTRLAELSGVAAITIYQYETNKRQPRIEHLQAIASALGITILNLIEDHTPVPVNCCDPSLEERVAAAWNKLNAIGQEKAIERIEELAEIPKYQR